MWPLRTLCGNYTLQGPPNTLHVTAWSWTLLPSESAAAAAPQLAGRLCTGAEDTMLVTLRLPSHCVPSQLPPTISALRLDFNQLQPVWTPHAGCLLRHTRPQLQNVE